MQVSGGYCSMINFRQFAIIVWVVCVCLLMLFLPNIAHAQDTYWKATYGSGPVASSADAACRAGFALYVATSPTSSYGSTVATTSPGRFDCMIKRSSGSTFLGFQAVLTTCPASAPYYDPIEKICVKSIAPPPDLCDVPNGQKMTFSVKEGSSAVDGDMPDNIGGYPKSSPTCYYDGLPELRGCYHYFENGRKHYACTYSATSNGKAVAKGQGPEAAPEKDSTNSEPPIMPPKPAPDDKNCPKGTVNAGLSSSGIPMCIGQGTDPKNPPAAPPKVEVEKNEVMPDGSTQNTKSVTTKNADGSTTTVKTVTVTKSTGEKETTQEKNTTQTPAGRPGKETEQPEKQNDLCKQNPNLAMCKNSTVGGKCGETSCTGDAIQCATLRATAILQCKAEKDELDLKASPLAAKGQSAMDGSDMEGLPGPKNGLVVNVNTMKSEGWLGNGAAFEDVSVNLRGHEILIPLSKWSSYLLPFRYMLMIIASLISYRILAGAVLKE